MLLPILRTRELCKYNVYSFVQNVRAAIQLPSTANLPAFIDNPKEYIPKKLPKADICIALGPHKDVRLELPNQLKKASDKSVDFAH
jgi:thymidylate synthase